MVQVIDASVAIAWCVPAQATALTHASLVAAIQDGCIVPTPFWFDLLYNLERLKSRGLLGDNAVKLFLDDIAALEIIVDDALQANEMMVLHQLAQAWSLTTYDAAYLELALRTGSALATRDAALAHAARAAGAPLFTL